MLCRAGVVAGTVYLVMVVEGFSQPQWAVVLPHYNLHWKRVLQGGWRASECIHDNRVYDFSCNYM
jgi:hypothetical protein